MEIRHLKYFIAVAEELSFSKAAKRLNMSQPPLSKQIKDLENDLDQKLFIRDNKKVELTEAGVSFLFKSYKIIKEIEDTKQYLRTLNKNEKKEISIGFSETALTDLVSIVKLFKKQFTDISIKLHRLSSPKQLSSIEDGFIDIGFICTPILKGRYNTLVLNKHSYNMVLPKEHYLSNYNSPISIDELENETFIITPRKVSPAYYDAFFSIFNNNNFYPTNTITAYSSTAIIALITAGLGIALVPSSIKHLFANNKDISFKEIKRTSKIETSIIWDPYNTSPEIEKLIHLAREFQQENLKIE
ncbi:LysR family transcriptional regulator [Oceanobacillus jeddahense]|uniref:LysR family transcriptional regulator n=1 Tax=Oceanobacillus jeddahense TaxID=1462527 RepID=UPI000595F5C3|nr:LysR substrate-binding domain-containing protein [Oceanobacillus jeddahense]